MLLTDFNNDSMLNIFIYETNGLIDELEEILLRTEKDGFTTEDINNVFRCMHTIKGSSAMMDIHNISSLTHVAEDLFSYIRENPDRSFNGEEVTDLLLRAVDFVKKELTLMQGDNYVQTYAEDLLKDIREYLERIQCNSTQRRLKAHLFFDDGCKMENIRAFGVLKSIEDIVSDIETIPLNLDDDSSAEEIAGNGFQLIFSTDKEIDEIRNILQSTMFIKSLNIGENKVESVALRQNEEKIDAVSAGTKNFVSVDVSKLDRLLDIVGELVIAESMLLRTNMDDDYEKAYRRLQRMTDELQNTVMQVRMIPVSGLFHKMQRAVRDLCKKTGKDISLVIEGADTEVDKRIIDNLSEPLIHLIRNAVDHGIETKEERISKGKDITGKILLEAYNEGGEVIIAVFDDGKGLNKEKIIQKALGKGLISSANITDSEAYNLITLAGFSTNDEVTELSGRGVGMDVVQKEIMKAGGKLYIESKKDQGTAIIMKFPLTLAIIDGVGARLGKETYIIPALNVTEIFNGKDANVINNQGHEMVMLRNEIYPFIRLGNRLNTPGCNEDIEECQLCLVKSNEKQICLLVDSVINKQKIVVKPMPQYIVTNFPGLSYFSGCTITGDGFIRLILDVNAFSK